MKTFYRFCALLVFVLAAGFATAQNITGRWEGVMMNNEFIQLNIEQKGDQICGFTYDYVLDNPKSFCKAKFQGYLDKRTNTWFLRGVDMMTSSGDHVLMRLAVWREKGESSNRLHVAVSTGSLMRMSEVDETVLSRVASRPMAFPVPVEPCFPPPPKKIPDVAKPSGKPVPVKPATPKPTVKPPVAKTSKPVVKPPVSQPKPKTAPALTVKKDTVKKTVTPPQTPKVSAAPIVKQMVQRRQSEQSRIAINSNHINLKVYDNGEIDNDTVSIFYNKKLLISHKKLSDKPLELDIDLDPGTSIHEITLFAENLGSIPPNTALVVVTAGNRRYELRSKASLEENAVLIFEYKPPGEN